jgi:hypothetical protein
MNGNRISFANFTHATAVNKSRRTQTRKYQAMDFTEADQEEAAHVLTIFAKAINPTIDEAETFDLMMEMLDHDLTVDRVTLYGAFIRNTASVTTGALQ